MDEAVSMDHGSVTHNGYNIVMWIAVHATYAMNKFVGCLGLTCVETKYGIFK
jgi:hypothetical protein